MGSVNHVIMQVVETVDGRLIKSAKTNLHIYHLHIYTGRTLGYIRTLIHVSSLVLRLQLHIVTCEYSTSRNWCNRLRSLSDYLAPLPRNTSLYLGLFRQLPG
jgi:hypothetical protein